MSKWWPIMCETFDPKLLATFGIGWHEVFQENSDCFLWDPTPNKESFYHHYSGKSFLQPFIVVPCKIMLNHACFHIDGYTCPLFNNLFFYLDSGNLDNQTIFRMVNTAHTLLLVVCGMIMLAPCSINIFVKNSLADVILREHLWTWASKGLYKTNWIQNVKCLILHNMLINLIITVYIICSTEHLVKPTCSIHAPCKDHFLKIPMHPFLKLYFA